MSVNPDAKCGICGVTRDQHDADKDGNMHCVTVIDGVRHVAQWIRFTDKPTVMILGKWIETKPELHAQLVQQWRNENGHANT